MLSNKIAPIYTHILSSVEMKPFIRTIYSGPNRSYDWVFDRQRICSLWWKGFPTDIGIAIGTYRGPLIKLGIW